MMTRRQRENRFLFWLILAAGFAGAWALVVLTGLLVGVFWNNHAGLVVEYWGVVPCVLCGASLLVAWRQGRVADLLEREGEDY